ncbi:MAG TPA: hypothetical protein VF707_03905 [Ardenticatenaceae bacterium]
MPRLSVWMVRAALLHLGFGFFLGGLILWQKGPGGIPGAWQWLPVHIHMVLMGWTVQLAFGVAYWILPRFAQREAEQGRVEQLRGREGLAWASFVLFNASTLTALAAPLGWAWALPISGILAALAGFAFVLHAWPRVKPFMA